MKDNHYYLPLPLRNRDVFMPNNYHLAEQRAQYLAKKLKKNNTTFAKEYKLLWRTLSQKAMLKKCHQKMSTWTMAKCGTSPTTGCTTNVRKPFEWCLIVPPHSRELHSKSCSRALTWPIHSLGCCSDSAKKFALMADIEGMFHQVRVNKEDSNFLRFLWWPNGDVNQPLAQYRMIVHLFGAIASPSGANFALKKTADDNRHSFTAAAVDTIKSNFYVDDCLKSVPSEKAAINLIKELSELCVKVGFNLTNLT